jgi:hypothetical protein
MPMYKADEHRYGSKEAGESRGAAWRPFYLLLYLFSSGEMRSGGNIFAVDVSKFREINKINSIHLLLKPLSEYGFLFNGLNDYRIPKSTSGFEIEFPDNPLALTVLSLVAKKVAATQMTGGWNHFGNSFLSWNYRILKNDLSTDGFGFDSDYVADKMHNAADSEFVYTFHKLMDEMGYFHERGGWNEGPDLSYYDKKTIMDNRGPYLFKVMSWKGDLRLMLRIRNAEKCLDYAAQCPERIKDMFRHIDPGCQNQYNGKCKGGVSYFFEGKQRRHCGCCSPAFQVYPITEEIPNYLRLVELGAKK